EPFFDPHAWSQLAFPDPASPRTMRSRPAAFQVGRGLSDHALRIANGDVRGVGVRAVEYGLYGSLPGDIQNPREVNRNGDRSNAGAAIHRLANRPIAPQRVLTRHPPGGDEPVHEFAARLALLLVVDAEWDTLDIETDPVAEENHLHQGHQQGDREAAGIAPDLQRLLECHREKPTRAHTWARPLCPPETSWTNTSSRVGG